VSATIASQQKKRAEINRTYKSKEHVKERLVENQRNKRHSTKTAQLAADVDGVIEATKKKRANKKQRYQESSTCENTGQNYCAEEERKLMAIAVTTVVGRISAPIPGTPWNLRLF
jgi:septal ring factor EnvC (AmiA/AmiB activator)